MTTWRLAELPLNIELETKRVLKALPKAHAALAELKGIASTIPDQNILINTLGLQEAKESSAIENIITTDDDLYKSELNIGAFKSLQAKEVQNYIAALIKGVEQTAKETIALIVQIKELMLDYKHRLRDNYKFYSQDLLNNLFKHPYTKIEFVVNDLGVSRLTAANYLNKLADDKMLRKNKLGTGNYYINEELFNLLTKR